MAELSDADMGFGAPAPAAASKGELSDADMGFGAASPKLADMSGLEQVGAAIKNVPSSAMKLGHDIAQPFLHPIETATNLKNVAQGGLEKAGIISGDEHVKYADAVGEFFKARYGSWENAKRSMIEDPVGVAADLSTVLTGGGSLAARAPGVIGRVGEVAGMAGRAVDPLSAAVAATKGAGKLTSEVIGGLGTHTGGESLRLAAQAGYEGGAPAQAFRESLRGVAPVTDVVEDAKNALGNLRAERGNAYNQGMIPIKNDPTVLDFTKVDHAVNRVNQVKTYKGQNLDPKTQAIRDEMVDTVNQWKQLNPADFHTAEGMDALKQKLGNIWKATDFGTPQRRVAGEIYNAVRNTISNQVPEYARVMKGYEEAQNQIDAIQRELSIPKGNMGNVDTALRKLQSVLRNNVSTAYGRRAELADYLVKAGSPDLMYKLAGQALNPALPRGLGKLAMQIVTELGLVGGVTAGVGMMHALPIAATLPLMSPRAMGEAAYYAGRAAKPASYIPARPIGRGLLQSRDQQGQKSGGAVKKNRGFAEGGDIPEIDPITGLSQAESQGDTVARQHGGRVNRKARVNAILARHGIAAI